MAELTSPTPPDSGDRSIPVPGVENTGMRAKKAKIDWNKIVAGSNGTRAFIPEEFRKEVDRIEGQRNSFNELANQLAEREITISVESNDVYLALRKYFAENGYKDIWLKDIGLDGDALKEGVYVLNIIDKK